ncbi:MAG: hypothetical protein V5A88_09020, partial [Candidatus Thermoplasmatota archaeon]
MSRKIKQKNIKNKLVGNDRYRAFTFLVILALLFGSVLGTGLFKSSPDDIERKAIETESGETAYLIYEDGELQGVDVNDDGEVDDSTSEMTLWGSTKISDSHVGTELLALDDNGSITFGDNQEVNIVYNTTTQSLDFCGADLENIGSVDADVLSGEQLLSTKLGDLDDRPLHSTE